MTNLAETITALNNDVSYKSLNDMLSLTSFKEYTKKTVLCNVGEIPKDVYYVKSGIIRAYLTNSAGVAFNQAFFINNSFAGSFSALTQHKPSTITLECLTDCEILSANYNDVNDLLEQNIELATFGRKLFEKIFSSFEKRTLELSTLSATERYKKFVDSYSNVIHKIPQYHIASFLGITPIQLSRIKKELRK